MDKGMYGRNDRLIKEKRHDTYRQREKLPEPTICTECKATLKDGRWTWQEAPPGAYITTCPACQRIGDNYPAGYLEICGGFYDKHRKEIDNLIRNNEELEKNAHPLERIMDFKEEGEYTLVTTTGIHLARRIGEALRNSYQGELDLTYGDGEQSIRVVWHRD